MFYQLVIFVSCVPVATPDAFDDSVFDEWWRVNDDELLRVVDSLKKTKLMRIDWERDSKL